MIWKIALFCALFLWGCDPTNEYCGSEGNTVGAFVTGSTEGGYLEISAGRNFPSVGDDGSVKTVTLNISNDSAEVIVVHSPLSAIAGGFRIPEVYDAQTGDMLEAGGRVVARFDGDYKMTLDDLPEGRLFLVRHPAPGPFDLTLSARFDYHEDPYCPSVFLSTPSEICGNGFVEGEEVCDDANEKSGDGCFECGTERPACDEGFDHWYPWGCEGEPSACGAARTCTVNSKNGVDCVGFTVELELYNNGFHDDVTDLGVIEYRGVEGRCVIEESALGRSSSCVVVGHPCMGLEAVTPEMGAFAGWTGGCRGEGERCRLRDREESVSAAMFVTAESRIERFAARPAVQVDVSWSVAGEWVTMGVIYDGMSTSLGSQVGSEVVVERLDASGESLGLMTFPSEGFEPYAVRGDRAGNLYVVGGVAGEFDYEGARFSQKNDEGEGDVRDLLVLGLAPDGALRWSHQAGQEIPYDARGADLELIEDATGAVQLGLIVRDRRERAHVLSLDGDGQRLWERWFEATGEVALHELVMSDAGDFFVSGEKTGALAVDSALLDDAGVEVFVARFDSDGARLWHHLVGAVGFDEPSALALNEAQDALLFLGPDGGGQIALSTLHVTDAASTPLASVEGSEPCGVSAEGGSTRWLLAGASGGDILLGRNRCIPGASVGAMIVSRLASDGSVSWSERQGVTLGLASAPGGARLSSLALGPDDALMMVGAMAPGTLTIEMEGNGAVDAGFSSLVNSAR